MSTVPVPLDGSALAERALPYATSIARASGGRILLVRAVMAHTCPGVDPTAAHLEVTRRAECELQALADKLRADGLETEPHVYYGQAAEAIADTARHSEADLIAMSTHGRSGLARVVFGSVTDALLRRAEKPVLVVPSTCERTWYSRQTPRILVPLDGTAFAEEALGPARRLSAR